MEQASRLHRLAHLLRVNRGKIHYQNDNVAVLRCDTCGQLRTIATRWQKIIALAALLFGLGVLFGLLAAMSGCSAQKTAEQDHFPEPTKMVELNGEKPLTGSHCFEGPEVKEP